MTSSIVAYLPVAIFVWLTIALFRRFSSRIARGELSIGKALVGYWLILAVAPAVLGLSAIRLGYFLFRTFPAIPEPGWEVGFAYDGIFGMLLSYAVAVVAAVFACWRFVVLGRQGPDARAT